MKVGDRVRITDSYTIERFRGAKGVITGISGAVYHVDIDTIGTGYLFHSEHLTVEGVPGFEVGDNVRILTGQYKGAVGNIADTSGRMVNVHVDRRYVAYFDNEVELVDLPTGVEPGEAEEDTTPRCTCGASYIHDAPIDAHSDWCDLYGGE